VARIKNTRDALLQDVCEHPDDDAPRLVFADWLDDHGEHRRAEFIRLQVALAGMDEYDQKRPDLLDREWELLAVYRKRWQPGPSSPLGKHFYGSAFRRGFFARIELPAAILLEHGDELLDEWPLEELKISDLKGQLSAIAARPWLARVSSLNLSHNAITTDELRALFDSPWLGRLRRLTLRNITLTPEGMELLVRWPGLRRLTHLTLGNDYLGDRGTGLDNELGPDWLRRLLESAQLSALTSLILGGYGRGNQLTESDLALLAATPSLNSLTHLELACCGITADGFRALAKATGLPALRHLSAGWNSGGAEGLPALVASPLLGRLDKLDLSASGFAAADAVALAASPHLDRLRCLNLTQCYLEAEEAKAIAKARFGSLTELNLFNSRIGPEGMIALARSPHLAKLTRLHLEGGRIGPEGLEALVRSPILGGLRYLEMGACSLGSDGVKILTGASWSRLRHLSLWHCDIGARGARAVLSATNLSGLWTLDLSGSKMTDATARHAAATTPLCQLRRLLVDRLSERGLTKEGEQALAASPRLPHLLVIGWTSRFSDREGYVSESVLKQGKGREL
jgi:uncharacterized protein (TIGR02996 family)